MNNGLAAAAFRITARKIGRQFVPASKKLSNHWKKPLAIFRYLERMGCFYSHSLSGEYGITGKWILDTPNNPLFLHSNIPEKCYCITVYTENSAGLGRLEVVPRRQNAVRTRRGRKNRIRPPVHLRRAGHRYPRHEDKIRAGRKRPGRKSLPLPRQSGARADLRPPRGARHGRHPPLQRSPSSAESRTGKTARRPPRRSG